MISVATVQLYQTLHCQFYTAYWPGGPVVVRLSKFHTAYLKSRGSWPLWPSLLVLHNHALELKDRDILYSLTQRQGDKTAYIRDHSVKLEW